MRTATSSFAKSLAAPDQLGAIDIDVMPKSPNRRAKRRRQMLAMFGTSYFIDVLILLLYAYAGTTSFDIGLAYGICGLLFIATLFVLFESGASDRFKDHFLVIPQSGVSLGIKLLFIYIAPEVSGVFLCSIFLIFTFGAFRSNPRQTMIGWTMATAGLGALFLLTDKPIAFPHGNLTERLATMLVFVLVLGRGMIVGLVSNSLYESLYKRGLELKKAYMRIEELAELDELTGSLNRRSILRTLDEEIVRAQRNAKPLSVALIDLDLFKRINDEFGHLTGDEVLRTFAISMFANNRNMDKFGRYGGEEFLLILPETANATASRMMGRLREIISDLDWSAISSGMTVTISAGVATLRPNEDSDSLLARADAALYKAKHLGRNQVAMA